MTHVFAAGVSLRQALTVALLASLAVLAGTAGPSAQMLDDIIVKYDQSQLLPLPRQASEIIVGNPVIADVSVQAGNLLVVTGKSFGITNMIVLDAKREVIFEKRVLVKREDARVVNLQRGTLRQTFNCTPQCNPTVTIGDDPAYFDSTLKAAEKKSSMSEKAADSGSQGNSQ
jgi:Flp pilus assembly secretin CpaC